MIVIKPLKKMTPGNHGKHIFFSKLRFTTKIVNSKSLKKNLSSAFVDDERPYAIGLDFILLNILKIFCHKTI